MPSLVRQQVPLTAESSHWPLLFFFSFLEISLGEVLNVDMLIRCHRAPKSRTLWVPYSLGTCAFQAPSGQHYAFPLRPAYSQPPAVRLLSVLLPSWEQVALSLSFCREETGIVFDGVIPFPFLVLVLGCGSCFPSGCRAGM